MKKLIKIIVIISLLFLTACGRVTEQQARQALHNHLLERYGEEFEIGYMGRRSTGKKNWYQAEIYPSKYKGTPREYDKYYHRSGNVTIGEGIFGESIDYVGDVYRIVLMNESANEFYLPKLKELFGENVLPILDINIAVLSRKPEFLKELKERMKEGGEPQIKGGIYIFGRVENDKDREWYRKQIYEFVQFMKQTGTFEYVDLDVFVIDERVVKNDMLNNNEVLTTLENNRKKLTRKEFFNLRNELLGEYPQKDTIQRNILQINKGAYIENGIKDMLYQGIIFYKKLYSPKYIESQNLNEEPKIEYNSLEELKFDWEKY